MDTLPLTIWHRATRGLLELRGTDRASFLQGMVSNDVLVLAPGQMCHAALLDTTGHVLADLHVHAFADALIVETDPECLLVLSQTLSKLLIMEDVTLAEVSADWAIVTVLAGGADALPGEKRPSSAPFPAAFDLWLATAETLTVAGAVTLTGDEAETLRVEAGTPKWGSELSASVLLPEAGMEDAVSYTKGCYVGQEIIARLHARGQANRGLRFVLLADDAPVPPIGAAIHVPEDGSEPGREIGRVTSAVASPRRGGQALALAFIRKEYFADGTPVTVQVEQPGGLLFAYDAVVQEIGPEHRG